jgi:hypothetical protein
VTLKLGRSRGRSGPVGSRARIPGSLRATNLVASDGCMNVPNECRSVESDEETVIDRYGPRVCRLGRPFCMSRSDRPVAVGRAAVAPEPALSARAVGDRFLRSTVPAAIRTLIVTARGSCAIC